MRQALSDEGLAPGENHPDSTNKKGVAAVLDPEACIGCGVCVCKRKSQSLKLEQREVVHDPSQTGRDFAMQFMMDHQAAQARGEGKARVSLGYKF
jgi:NAD-dependent dihydropyrimidine dehydrogenase PreA subunit